ncbi:DUF4440 domain-containing protein [Nocardioides sp. CN2-186]|uniref:DUF4440 domain-containing protein n=1 Tax=Nocardioides tweenelious TaxID=3156607 RepID=UPI0032B408E0
MTDDHADIEAVVATFFAAFTSGPDLDARLDQLRTVLLPEAVVTRTCGQPATYDVEGFIEPRRELLSSERLTDFREWEVEGTTQVWGDVAQRWSRYAKAWVESGTAATGSGTKSIQLVRTDDGWRISAVAWDDERP